MTSPHGRRLQTRRALAIMTWATLTLCAWLLWYGQRHDVIRIQAWEPAALVLSAYATFLSIFGWMLFSPGNRSAEESPGLFFSGLLTLIPPCFIAYNLMPDNSPLRPWLTIGVFVFGVLAIMSPLPKEVFAVPRDRRSYLQPLTDAYLSELNVDAPEVQFEEFVPDTRYWLTQPQPENSPHEPARDPWSDPFYGTGRQISRVGVSQSRRNESSKTDLPNLPSVAYERSAPHESSRSPEPRQDAHRSIPAPLHRNEGPSRGASITLPNTGSRRPLTEPGQTRTAPASGVFPVNVPSAPVPPALLPSWPGVTTDHRGGQTSRNLSPPPLPNTMSAAPTARTSPGVLPSTVPQAQPAQPMGFQAPGRPDSRPLSETHSQPSVTSAPKNSYTPPAPPRVAEPTSHAATVRTQQPVAPTTLKPLSTETIATLASGMLGGAATVASPAVAPVVARLAETPKPTLDSMESRSAEIRSIVDSVQKPDTTTFVNPVSPMLERSSNVSKELEKALQSSSAPTAHRQSPSLQDLDRQLRQLEEEEEKESDTLVQEEVASRPVATRSVQTNGDVSMERIADEHGGEMIEGTIKVFFEVGQKRAHLHVPFSPPLGGLPEVECEPAHDDGVRVKVAVRQPYGIRIEARRTEAEESLRSEVSFAAVYTKKS